MEILDRVPGDNIPVSLSDDPSSFSTPRENLFGFKKKIGLELDQVCLVFFRNLFIYERICLVLKRKLGLNWIRFFRFLFIYLYILLFE